LQRPATYLKGRARGVQKEASIIKERMLHRTLTLNINHQQQMRRRGKKMKRIKFTMKTMVALGMFVLGCSLAQAAGADRTWVSGIGNDADPCSRTAPCKTFAGAFIKTADGGQINVIDAGAYGPITITHSITIDASESFAGVLAAGVTAGIKVDAGPSDVVVLRGLDIDGNEGGQNGILFVAGGKLYVEDCRIYNFAQRGIDFEPNGKSELFVKDSIIRENDAAGILIQPGVGGAAKAVIEQTRLEGNQNGLSVLDNAKVTIRDSVSSTNTSNGVLALTSVAAPEVNVENCFITHNVNDGIKASGNKAKVRLSGSTVTANDTGLFPTAGGTIDSFSNNNIDGNISSNGVPSNPIPQL
jgi:hypothetical protein